MSYQLWISPITGYRRRGTSLAELNALFEKGLTAASICEPLRCCSLGDPVEQAYAELSRLDFDVVGVRDNRTGLVVGWVEKKALSGVECSEHIRPFEPNQLVSDSIPLVDIIHVLAEQERVFVMARRGVSDIVTRADLRKPPTRVLIFGLVSLLEMHLSYWVREKFPDESWRASLNVSRIAKLDKLLTQRKERGESISSIDCLQLCDKREILTTNEVLRDTLGLGSRKAAIIILKSIEHLRDGVAHSQEDFVGKGGWGQLSGTIRVIERVLQISEAAIDLKLKGTDSNKKT